MKENQIKSFLDGGLILSAHCIREQGKWPYDGHFLFDKPVPGFFMYTIFDAIAFCTFTIMKDPERDDKLIISNGDITVNLTLEDMKIHINRGMGGMKSYDSIMNFIELLKEKENETC